MELLKSLGISFTIKESFMFRLGYVTSSQTYELLIKIRRLYFDNTIQLVMYQCICFTLFKNQTIDLINYKNIKKKVFNNAEKRFIMSPAK